MHSIDYQTIKVGCPHYFNILFLPSWYMLGLDKRFTCKFSNDISWYHNFEKLIIFHNKIVIVWETMLEGRDLQYQSFYMEAETKPWWPQSKMFRPRQRLWIMVSNLRLTLRLSPLSSKFLDWDFGSESQFFNTNN